MKLFYVNCILFALFLQNIPVLGQNTAVYPDQFGAYFNNMYLVSPAYVPLDTKMDINVAYKTGTGALNKIATFNVAFTRVLNYTKPKNHIARVYFYNQKDGPYIHRTRAYANYAYKIKIGKETFLSSGIAFGFAQTAFTAPSSSGNGNSLAPDAALGVSLNHKKNEAGISINQLLNSTINPVIAPIKYERYINSYIQNTFTVSPFVSIKCGALWRYLPSYTDDVSFFGMLQYKDVISIGSSYKYNKSLSFIVTTNIHIGTERIFISFVYNTPFFTKLPAWTDSVELNGGYTFY
ncbi:type IX secretion system membrane protein PorP/SprF [uncultured Cytophaga sp.]|uniref:type IX secretion system membrane protein PorP/SprF n=1 Tax=uncultured Cytophaga sp. TaxID=160238 RepID=UPI0026181E65|nr:type IX secretion system membrane protein PorP/SprF [uncultured Cytophaga sp.]